MKPVPHPFKVKSISIGNGPLTLIAGPCLAESQSLCEEVAGTLKETCLSLGIPYIFKASFDKANRTSANSNRGDGMEAGLSILSHIAKTFNLPITTDLHDASQANTVASVVDILQVPAFLCRQSDLLEACAQTGKPVNVKKGQFLAPWDTKNIVEKLTAFDATGIMLTDRGTSFGYNTLVVDMPGLEIMRSYGHPVCFDATHSAQRPGGAGTTTGGNRDSIPAMARAAVSVGVDALFLEVHPDPANAASDAATQWPLDRATELLEQLLAIDQVRRTFN
ncbi:MAG: 3-deoxy-8-phosphooctulonate synthase [Fimbriimonadaceae bacterium]